jgi:acyl-coenzyme A synthetase/AMP-(fatty) acid ligase/thioesterase domain-containing protein
MTADRIIPRLAFERSEIENSIGARFEQVVARFPDAVALQAGPETWTYASLDQFANRLALQIPEVSPDPATPVALLFNHGPQAIGALLGVLKAGRAYCALNLRNPPARLSEMLASLEARVVVCSGATVALAESLHPPAWIDVDGLPAGPRSAGYVCPPLVRGALAGIFFTSGSTGQPKGVMRSQRSLMHRLWLSNELEEFPPARHFSHLFNISFASSLTEIFVCLLNGVTLHPYDAARLGIAPFGEWLNQEGIEILHIPVALFRQFLDNLPEGAAFPHVKRIMPIGRLYWKDVQRCRKYFSPACRLISQLGSTETAVTAHILVDPAGPAGEGIVPVGYPVPDKAMWLEGEDGQPAPAGAAGEIVVRSRFLCSGFWRQPELTTSRFTSAPGDPELCTFHTGDLGRWLPDGSLELIGRKDSQVKVGGFYRVDLAEIEDAIFHTGLVSHIAITTCNDAGGEKQVMAYVVLNGPPASLERLKAALARTLPDYMIPARFICLDQMPLTANGKVDYQHLPAPQTDQPAAADPYQAPASPVEEKLAVIWAEVLGVRRVGRNDNFFDLGGQSILGAALFARIERAFGVRIPLPVLIQAPTVASLTAYLEHPVADLSWQNLVTFRAGGSRPPLFLIHGINGRVLDYAGLANRLGPDQPVYGLVAAGIAPHQEPDPTIEAMAERYVQTIRTVQPRGPYRLGGYCFGGIIAYEMARQLEALGETCALVAVFEGILPGQSRVQITFTLPRLRLIWNQVPFWFKDYPQLGFHGIWHRIRRRFQLTTRAALHRLGRPGRDTGQDVLVVETRGLPEEEIRLMRVHQSAFNRYVPQPYSGSVTLFMARYRTISQAFFGPADLTAAWVRLAAAGIQVRTVEGAHRNLHLPPYLPSLAAALHESLEQTMGRAESTGA